MTNQEAYTHIKSRLKEYIQCTDDNIALYKALKALEKQIPIHTRLLNHLKGRYRKSRK